MQPLNYASQSMAGLSALSRSLSKTGAHDDSKRVDAIIGIIEDAVHFQLPEGGRVLDDNLRGIRGQDFKIGLPFPAVTVSFFLPATSHKDIPGLPVVATKRMPIAYEDQGEIFMISVYMIDEASLWCVSPVGIRFNSEKWEPNPGEAGINENTITDTMTEDQLPRFAGRPFVVLPSYIDRLVELYGYDDGMRVAMDDNADIGSVFELIEALSCSNVRHDSIQKADPAVNRRRQKSGKAPLFDIHALTIEVPGRTAGPRRESLGGTHASPREHLRRGHIRRYADGKRIMIPSTVVNPGGGGSFGSVQKWYTLKNAKNR